MRPSTREGFTIALICALTLEADAVEALFDETYDRLSVQYRKQSGDYNAYVNGRIGNHNVVLCYMPDIGKKSAASAISSMKVSYTRIEVALLIGICGGAPYPSAGEEIFLGDVIISDAVIEYDFGRQYPGGPQRKTGVKDTLGRPNREIRSLLAGLKARQSRIEFQGKMMEYLHDIQESDAHWRRPSGVDDILFEAKYQHKHHDSNTSKCLCLGGDSPDDICDDALVTPCSALGCEDSKIERQRQPTEVEDPTIHIGTIASADSVLKSAEHRDSLVKTENVIGFEMEGAGVWDNISCLIIKGMCDYADSHKNKSWQAYAAATGASAAKALLGYWSIKEESEPDIKGSWMVPFLRNSAFVGREDEITKIEDMMNRAPKIAICGLGGVGKTQIALELAHRMRDKDPSCSVFWIPCTGFESIEQVYMSLAQTIGIVEVKPAEAKERVKAHLSQANGRKWLMIFDNADDIEIWATLKQFLPQNQQGRIIFTSRNRAVAVKMASLHMITISEPDPQTSLRILEESLVDQPMEHGVARVLLERLTFLPLAIIQAAAYMNENQITVSAYINLLGQQESAMIELLSEEFEDEHRYEDIQNPTATTWWISFQQIQRFNKLAADYLGFIACINPRDIPKSLLPPPPSDNDGAKAIGLLKAYAFISEHSGGYYLSIHRLVYLAMRNWLKKNQKFESQVLKAADHLKETFTAIDHKNRMLRREYLSHTLSLMEEDDFQAYRERYICLLQKVGQCLFADGRYKEAELLLQQVVEAQKQILGPEHPEALSSMNTIALLYRKQGRWKEAENLGVQVMEAQKQVLGPEHRHTLRSSNTITSIYRKQGRWKEAEELGMQVMEAHKRLLGPEHSETLKSMSAMAVIYRTQGRFKDSEALGLQVMEGRRQALGLEHPDTLSSMNDVALIYAGLCRWKEAEDMFLQVIEVRKQILGPEHPHTLTTMGNMTSIFQHKGLLKEAEDLEMQVLESLKRVLGPEHYKTLASMENLANIWNLQDKVEDALTLMASCVELRNKVLGPDHPKSQSSSSRLKKWKEKDNQKSQNPQLLERPTALPPSVVITNPGDLECNIISLRTK